MLKHFIYHSLANSENIEKQTINEPNSFNVMNMCLCDKQKRHTEA